MDPTENARREMAQEINEHAGDRARLETEHGQVWDTREMQRDFDVMGFAAPFVVVVRKADGKSGSLTFQHAPRFYYAFSADK